MMLSLYIAAPALALWLVLPLLMRPAFRRAGLPPTAAASAVLAILVAAAVLVFADRITALSLAGEGAARAFHDLHYIVARNGYLRDLAFVALAVAGTAMMTKGLAQGEGGGLGLHLRRMMAGLGTYVFHAGVGMSALLAFGPFIGMPRRYVEYPDFFFWQELVGQIAAALLLAGFGLVFLSFILTLIRKVFRS